MMRTSLHYWHSSLMHVHHHAKPLHTVYTMIVIVKLMKLDD